MLTIETDHFDYNELTKVYLGGLHLSRLDQFLNTSQTGFAHSSSGTEVTTLLKGLFTAVSICMLQLLFFCLLRPTIKNIYQPRCYYVPVRERMEPLPDGLFAWVMPTIKYNTSYYLSMGLDTYFFIRFVSVLLLFFMVVGNLNLLVLVPVNWTGSSLQYSATGMDKLSVSNIAASKVHRLNFHFVMCLFTVAMFQWLIVYELNSFVKIRHSYLSSITHQASIIARTLLISNIPDDLKDSDKLIDLFSVVPGGVNTIWLSYDSTHMSFLTAQAMNAMDYLEKAQVLYLKEYYAKKDSKYTPWLQKILLKNRKHSDQMPKDHCKYEPSLIPQFYPPIYQGPFHMPVIDRTIWFSLPGILRIFSFQSRVSMIEWALTTLNYLEKEIEQEKTRLAESKLPIHNKFFIEFNDQIGASIASQCLLSYQGTLDLCLTEVHPKDVLWGNIASRNSYLLLIENYVVTLFLIIITVLYIIPVSFIGLLSQMPLITQLLPFFKWLENIPDKARDTISHLLPSILLSLLTEIMMKVFRTLSALKGMQTGASTEANLQHWYFAFLFVQQFIVITILASISVIVKQVVDKPTSIPILLALNLPKAATFFFQYLTVKALTFCGNNFLRIHQLVFHLTIYKFLDSTPRRKFARLTHLTRVKWGTTYPVYSVYSSIGLVYTIISPLISVFIIFVLCLVLVYYKYSLKFIYSHVNESETNGKLYPVALLHLYTGIYCLECCMIGILFLLKNERGECPLIVQGYLMCITFLSTVFFHYTLYKKYSRYFSYLPIIADKPENLSKKQGPDFSENSNGDSYYSDKKLLYLHNSFTYEYPPLWLPLDPLGISEMQIDYAESKVNTLRGGQTKGAIIKLDNYFQTIQIKVSEAPPGYK
ncbi:DUF221-domain-containing protein [Suhomyces tanzawaensis NRRL Y-17324]|uniref:DUF221-domain-containing protein n=1 Tax=Suhomyces tanzawaensis NRRL Y-17324 TaxID=984487 RepID=A0A1E4SF33_9ASCO|nr:DUF221-domain-containing protein [Suhomyces tanzawaensis NRRL Y-17324]ODV78127.1 DUF221-domain-containing protein [Suhomyces tanzawaensis NRRL Y-17324]